MDSQATSARRAAPVLAQALLGGVVATLSGLAVLVAAAAVPALAAQHRVTARMSPGPRWARIAAGAYHTCGIRTNGTLWCWGDNESGQLGLGNHASQDRPRQVTTPAATGWVSITAGDVQTCAIRAGGTLWCWGDNTYGQLGLANHTGQDRPQQVTTPAAGGWASVSTRGDHSCATRTGGTLWCWGDNTYGELGTGDQVSRDQPGQVNTPAAAGWTRLSAGVGHTCATRSDSTLWCWGANVNGELGIGNRISQDQPREVPTPGPHRWASITAGSSQTCATRANATLWCWGSNDDGQLGIGPRNDPDRPQPVTTPAPGGWTSAIAGGLHTCALRAGGTLWCWGDNSVGELGLGNHLFQDRPRQVTTPAPGGWAGLTASYLYTCAIRTGGTLWCWGDNNNGELGLGNHLNQDRPRQVTSCIQPRTQPAADDTARKLYSMALSSWA